MIEKNISKYFTSDSINESEDNIKVLLKFVEKQLEPSLKMLKRELKLNDKESFLYELDEFKDIVEQLYKMSKK